MDISRRNFLNKAIAAGGAGVIVSSGVARGDTNPDSSQGYPNIEGTINVKAYGAKGDGSTNDTAAFQAALDAASKAGGGIVSAPTGQYHINGNLVIPGGVTLQVLPEIRNAVKMEISVQ